MDRHTKEQQLIKESRQETKPELNNMGLLTVRSCDVQRDYGELEIKSPTSKLRSLA